MSITRLATRFLDRLRKEAMDIVAALSDAVSQEDLEALHTRLEIRFGVCREAWEEVGESDRPAYKIDANQALEEAHEIYANVFRLLNHREANPAVDDQVSSAEPAASSTPTPPCWLCAAPHSIESCPTFLEMTLPERAAIVAKAGVCWRCLQLTAPRHRSLNCPSTMGCSVCSKAHHVLVHGAPAAFPAAEQQPERQVSDNTPPVIVSVIVEELPDNPSSVVITELIEDREPQTYRWAAPDRAEQTVSQPPGAPGARAARLLAIRAKAGLLALTAPPKVE